PAPARGRSPGSSCRPRGSAARPRSASPSCRGARDRSRASSPARWERRPPRAPWPSDLLRSGALAVRGPRPPLHLFRRDVFLVGGDGPLVPEGVLDVAGAVPVELV